MIVIMGMAMMKAMNDDADDDNELSFPWLVKNVHCLQGGYTR